MNTDQIEGKYDQLKGKAKEGYGNVKEKMKDMGRDDTADRDTRDVE